MKWILVSAVDLLSLLLATNLIAMIIVFKESLSFELSFEGINRLKVKHFYVRYALSSLLTIISALILEVILKTKVAEFLLVVWGILLLVSFIYTFRSILLIIEIVFGNESTPKDKEKI